MNKKASFLRHLFIYSFVFIAACREEFLTDEGVTQTLNPAAISQQIDASINLVSLADLDQTIRIEVLRREDGDDSTSANYEELVTFTKVETILSLVEALDSDLELNPRADCPALYTLVFHLTDGRQHEFGYACEMASPSFLRGGQGFWQGQDVIAPDSFNRVISVFLNEDGSQEPLFQG
jgi:hypothetical protein